uniref:Uncharacterized protein MANES_18G064300 n=3 Tax=Rhizophora mucronata TaxID=61149 RepID=A0A2P2M1N2_RHIMU
MAENLSFISFTVAFSHWGILPSGSGSCVSVLPNCLSNRPHWPLEPYAVYNKIPFSSLPPHLRMAEARNVALIALCAAYWIRSAKEMGPPLEYESISFLASSNKVKATESPLFSGLLISELKRTDPFGPPVFEALSYVKASFSAKVSMDGIISGLPWNPYRQKGEHDTANGSTIRAQ